MRKLIKVKAPTTKKIVDTSPKPKRVSGEEVATVLGARPAGVVIPSNLPPDAHLDFVAQVAAEIVSTGGRPARKERTERKKIPLTKEEWGQLQAIAKECKLQGIAASPAQIGGILVCEGLKAYEVASQNDILGAAASSSASKLEQLGPVAVALLAAMKNRKPSRKTSGD